MASWEKELRDAVINNDMVIFKSILAREEVRRNGNLGRRKWKNGQDPLHQAALHGRNEMIQLLVEAGFNINSYSLHIGADRWTPLHMAVIYNQESAVNLLLDLGADPTLHGKCAFDKVDGTPLDWARQRGHSTIAALLEGHAGKKKLVKELYAAVNLNNLPALKNILTQELIKEIIARSEWKHGEDPVHHAAWNGKNDMIQLMTEAGFNINSFCLFNGDGKCTALHTAVYRNHEETVKLLLAHNADVTLQGKYDVCSGTALDWAKQIGFTRIVTVLEDHMGVRQPVTFDDIQTKAATEKELFDALNIQEQIDNRNAQLSAIEEDMRASNDRLEEAKRRNAEEVSRLEDEKRAITAEMDQLRQNPTFRSKEKIILLQKKVEDIKALVITFRTMILSSDSDSQSCPVCFEHPMQIFSCQECENWVCNRCREQLATCPSCRQDFLAKPPRRNRGIERALGI